MKNDWQEAPEIEQWVNYQKEMETRKIAVKNNSYIIRWGKHIKGMFTITEGYHIKAGRINNPDIKKWDRIWKIKTWPKVALFTWILLHERALTWDQLRRKGTHGPSRCTLCQEQEETMEHLANSCSINNNLWQNHQQLFEISDRKTGSITTLVEKWQSKPEDEKSKEEIWSQTIKNIRETIILEKWNDEDWKIDPTETCIMNHLQIKVNNTGTKRRVHKVGKARVKDRYRNSPEGFTKLNFDGAAKGNPREAEIAGIFRDDGGKTRRVYAMDCGNPSNNEAEFHALNRGL
eukprot:PITA_04883